MTILLATPIVRFHYVNVFKGVNSPLAPTRFKKKLTVLLSKTDPEHMAFKDSYATHLRGIVASQGGNPDLRAVSWRDGDAPSPKGKIDTNTVGHWMITPWCDPDAALLLRYMRGVEAHLAEDSSHIYSGAFGRVSMKLFAYTKGTPGITLGLVGVLKTKDGPRLDTGVSEEEVLASLGIGGGAAPVTSGVGRPYPEITDPAARAALGLSL